MLAALSIHSFIHPKIKHYVHIQHTVVDFEDITVKRTDLVSNSQSL